MAVREASNGRRIFTDEEEAFIAGRVAAGVRVLQIANEHGLSPQTIYNVLSRRKKLLVAIEPHSLTEAQNHE